MAMMLEVLIGVLVIEVKKVADEVTNMEVDKAAKFLTNTSGATCWPNFEVMKVAPPSSKISN
jgi:ribosomal protein L22